MDDNNKPPREAHEFVPRDETGESLCVKCGQEERTAEERCSPFGDVGEA